jgi:hypothetical protein
MNFITSLSCAAFVLAATAAQAGDHSAPISPSPALDFATPHPWKDWTLEFGVSWMTENDINNFIEAEATFGHGDAGAEIYQFTATKLLRDLPFSLFGKEYRPLLELPLCLEYVDQNANNDFFVSNFAFQLRWVDFPWNHRLHTTFGAGLGLSYASRIYAMDRQRHPNEDRSHLKFNLPIFVSFALPEIPEHQVRLYIAHHSGGFGTFDQGGVNSLGVSYAYAF